MTKTISHKLEVYQNRCLQRILRIFWAATRSQLNHELHRRTGTEPITQQEQSPNNEGQRLDMLTMNDEQPTETQRGLCSSEKNDI